MSKAFPWKFKVVKNCKIEGPLNYLEDMNFQSLPKCI